MATPTRKADTVSCTDAAGAPNVRSSVGRLGRYMAMESGANAVSAPRTRIKPPVSLWVDIGPERQPQELHPLPGVRALCDSHSVGLGRRSRILAMEAAHGDDAELHSGRCGGQ